MAMNASLIEDSKNYWLNVGEGQTIIQPSQKAQTISERFEFYTPAKFVANWRSLTDP